MSVDIAHPARAWQAGLFGVIFVMIYRRVPGESSVSSGFAAGILVTLVM